MRPFIKKRDKQKATLDALKKSGWQLNATVVGGGLKLRRDLTGKPEFLYLDKRGVVHDTWH